MDAIEEYHASILMHLMKRVFGTSCKSLALEHPSMLIFLAQREERLYTLSAQ